MAGKRKAAPQCVTKGHPTVDKGTMCRQQSPTPGPVGTEPGGFWDRMGSTLSGHGKSTLIWILDWIPFKPDSPYSTALLRHYVEGSGETYQLKEIPQPWQDWIVKVTKGKPGRHPNLDPYNSGLFDLRNSLGHFDVVVKKDRGSNLKTYHLSDTYQFGFKKNDRRQRGRHGFPCGDLDEGAIQAIRRLLPSGEYQNPGGFKERWEIKKVGKETILFIPQQFLAENGKPFKVEGSFTR